MATGHHEIRANFNRETIVVYQAYNDKIADACIKNGRFVEPSFSFRRMTWIKPSFLWLMARSGWAQKSGQTRILAVRITRKGFEKALSNAVLTDPDPRVYSSGAEWRQLMNQAKVHVQWDPERSVRGAKLEHRSIQIGLGREVITEFVEEWIVGVEDVTAKVKKIHNFVRQGNIKQAKRLLPKEAVYPLSEKIKKIIGADY